MSKKLLLVEDEAILAMVKQQELGGYNYDTSHVATGEQAIDLICDQNEDIDLILMDIDLGSGMDGTEAARRILSIVDIPIVFLSSHEEPEIVEKTEKITSYGYVVKSSNITVLDASIKMAFRLYESLQREKEKDIQLRQNEQRLSLAMDAAEHGFWDWNLTTGSVYFSPRWYTILGYEPGELPMGFDTWVDLLHPDSREIVDKIHQHVKDSEPFAHEFKLRCKNGLYKWIMGQGNSYEFNSENKPTRVVGIHIDITRKKETEDALRMSEEKYRNLFENLIDEVHIWKIIKNKTDKITGWELCDVNHSALKSWNKSKDEVVGKTANEIYNFDAHKAFSDVVEEIFETGKPLRWQSYFPPTGQHLEMDSIPLGDYFISTGRDISESKEAEKNLKINQHFLQKAQEIGVIGTWSINLKKNIISWTEQCYKIFGVEFNTPINFDFFIECVYSDDREYVKREWEAGIKNKSYDIEHRLLVNGEIKWVREKAEFIYNSKGRAIEAIGVVQDITGSKLNEQIIKRQLEEKEILLTEVHHRVRNNIANIKSILSLQALNAKNPEAVTALQEAATRVQGIYILYDNLLISEEYRDVSIKRYIENFIDSLLLVFAGNNKIKITKKISDFRIMSKKAALVGIIINELLTNAFKYAFKDCDYGEISVFVEKKKSEILLIIQDNGIGIDPAEKNLEGFGMKIVKMLVEQLSGTLNIENKDGTKITVRLEI